MPAIVLDIPLKPSDPEQFTGQLLDAYGHYSRVDYGRDDFVRHFFVGCRPDHSVLASEVILMNEENDEDEPELPEDPDVVSKLVFNPAPKDVVAEGKFYKTRYNNVLGWPRLLVVKNLGNKAVDPRLN